MSSQAQRKPDTRHSSCRRNRSDSSGSLAGTKGTDVVKGAMQWSSSVMVLMLTASTLCTQTMHH